MNIQDVWCMISTNYQAYKWILSLSLCIEIEMRIKFAEDKPKIGSLFRR